MSFEDCSVVGIKPELYLFFASWEKFTMICCLKPLRVSANVTSVTLFKTIEIVLLSFCKKI